MQLNIELNSDYEINIFTNVHLFTSCFNNVNFNEKDILEIISIAFYGGRYISNIENQLYSFIFDKYIKLTINHYANFIAKELSSFMNFTKSQYDEKINNIINETNKYIENDIIKHNNTSYKMVLHSITNYFKNKYMMNKNEYLYISNPSYKELFHTKYIAINGIKYVQYLIINEYFEDICSIILLSNYKNAVTKEDIITIKNNCEKEDCETTFIYQLYQKIDSPNVSYTDFNQFIENILKNGIKTPYYYESSYKDYFENMLDQLSEKMNNFLTPEHEQLFNFIVKIKENIVKQGIDSKELINDNYPNICTSEIIKNKLNINEFTAKMFYEYFMASKSEANLALTLGN